MKIAGALTMIVGIIAGIVFFQLPARVSVLGTSLSCAPPVIQLVAPDTGSVDDTFTAAVMQDCKNQSLVRTLLGLVVFTVSIGGGAIMLVVGSDKRTDPQWAWHGYRWVNRG